jgi:hypothetical protein
MTVASLGKKGIAPHLISVALIVTTPYVGYGTPFRAMVRPHEQMKALV